MTPIRVAGPTVEPVSLAEMRAYLRLDSDDGGAEDGLIGALLGEPQAAAPPRPAARHADASRGPSQDDRNFLEKLFGVGE